MNIPPHDDIEHQIFGTMNEQAPWDYQELFSKQDFQFLLNVFSHMYKSESSLIKTLEKPSARHKLLAREELFEAVQHAGSCAPVSSYLYYCSQVTHTLMESGIREHLMSESLSMSIYKVAQGIQNQMKPEEKSRLQHIPLTMLIGMKDNPNNSNRKSFQVVGDLKKACVVIEGTLTERKVTSDTSAPWPM